jgi:hypothetical protein
MSGYGANDVRSGYGANDMRLRGELCDHGASER